MNLLIKNGHVIEPRLGIDNICNIVIEHGKIKNIQKVTGEKAQKRRPNKPTSALDNFRIINSEGQLVIPGLIDMHVHLREPGYEYKESIKTGTAAAVRGGISSVCCMPNTKPVNDNASITKFIIKKAKKEGSCKVFPIGAITKRQQGKELAEFDKLHEAGCVAFSDDGNPVMNSLLMRKALEYAKMINVPIISHCEDIYLSAGGVMNEGQLSGTLGLRGIPAQAEEIMVARDIALAELTGGRLHIAHVSTSGSVELLRAAKKRGIADITAETCPHYFSITEDAVEGYNTNAKVNPPLRGEKDIEAIKQGLQDGTIDVIATDHAPHHRDEKLNEFDLAPSGISGLETSIGLSMKLVDEGVLTLSQLIEKMAIMPAKIMGLTTRGIGMIKSGADADLTIIATKKKYRVNVENFVSKGKNTPFEGWSLKAKPAVTITLGRIYEWE